MNYLQLVNRLVLESGLGDALATVSGQEDDSARAVAWISEAWVDIQTSHRHHWSFMKEADGSPRPIQVLEQDTDLPHLPREYQMAIVWKALADYSRSEGNEFRGLKIEAIAEYRRIHTRMLSELLPEIRTR